MRPNCGRLLGYASTGGTAAIVDIGGFRLLSTVGTHVIIAATCSFCVAAVVNFLLTSRWVFHVRATGRGFFLFLMGATAGLLVNVAVDVSRRHISRPARHPGKDDRSRYGVFRELLDKCQSGLPPAVGSLASFVPEG